MRTRLLPAIDLMKSFNPIKIELTIESELELTDLYHRLNVSKMDIIAAANSTDSLRGKARLTNSFESSLFELVNGMVKAKKTKLYD